MSYPSPCDSCPKTSCRQGCSRWKIRYLYRQKQINAYAKSQGEKPLKIEFSRSPCSNCTAQEYCDYPCKGYLRWYNSRMEAIRRRYGLEPSKTDA